MIRLEHVTKTYQNKHGITVLDDINLHIRPGDFAAIVGPSGSGKSTLLYVLGLLDHAHSGTIFFFGRETHELTETERSALRGRCIGFVFQSFLLIPHLSVKENVKLPLFYQGYGPSEREDMATMCLERVKMDHRLNHLPSQLSGGECQRVAIARALVADPALILADEPTGNLDSKTGDAIFKIFEELHEQGRTIALITHAPDLAEKAPRTIRIADGKIVEDSDP